MVIAEFSANTSKAFSASKETKGRYGHEQKPKCNLLISTFKVKRLALCFLHKALE
jgi:hypothetical protein